LRYYAILIDSESLTYHRNERNRCKSFKVNRWPWLSRLGKRKSQV